MKIERLEEVEAWQAARSLTRGIYQATARIAFSRDLGLCDQIQRAAVSIMANVAEGFDSQTNQGFLQFLGYAVRSATEVQSHLCVALDQGYLPRAEFEELYQQTVMIKRMIHGFMRYLRKHTKRPRPPKAKRPAT